MNCQENIQENKEKKHDQAGRPAFSEIRYHRTLYQVYRVPVAFFVFVYVWLNLFELHGKHRDRAYGFKR